MCAWISACESPKGIRKNGGLDVKAAERQAKVQKEQVRKS